MNRLENTTNKASGCTGCSCKTPCCKQTGFQLTELVIVLAIIGLISSVAVPAFTQYAERARMNKAILEMMDIELLIQRYVTMNFAFPDNLNQVMTTVPSDPWGRPYEYLRIDGGNTKGKGKLRKDKNLVPVNSDFDLYSKGKDGKSVSPFTAKHSRDDIVRANNGAYYGRAKDY